MKNAITIGVNVAIPNETAERCMRILELWMDDNPDCILTCEQIDAGDRFKHKLTIKRQEEYGKE